MTIRDDVVALYVDPGGPYPNLLSQWYDAERDARAYKGELPIVAHPPCGPWGRLRHLSRNDDPALAPLAIAQVRRVGGVLEHPATSLLWSSFGLPRPGDAIDAWGGQTIAVNQCDFGHVARKATWLYIVRVGAIPPMPPPREPTHWISGSRRGKPTWYGGRIPPGIKVCSAQQRRRTPVGFALFLIEIAASVAKARPDEAA